MKIGVVDSSRECPFKKNGISSNLNHSFSNSIFNFIKQMRSIPHEPNIIDQEKKETYNNLSKVVGDACEAWLRKKGIGTYSFRDQMNNGYQEQIAKKNK